MRPRVPGWVKTLDDEIVEILSAELGKVARTLKDGSRRLLVQPRRTHWYTPSRVATSLQWSPAMGITRYEFARRHTPLRQRPYWEHLRRLYKHRPPTLLPVELVQDLATSVGEREDGLKAIVGSRETKAEFKERVLEHEIWSTDPTGEWRFTIHAEVWRGYLADRLTVQCTDQRTMPDWELLVRMRAWILTDDREACVWLPDQDLQDPTWRARYENERFNCLAMISPRRVQPNGLVLPRASAEDDPGPSGDPQ